MTGRPSAAEYADFYKTYVSKVSEDDAVEVFARSLDDTSALLRTIDEATAGHRYAEEKWSIRQVLGHLIDAERVLRYRALAFARGDRSPIPGMDQEVWMGRAGFDDRAWADLVAEYEATRRETLAMFRGMPPDAWLRSGTASNCEFTVRALAYIIAGHERHHIGVLRERYL